MPAKRGGVLLIYLSQEQLERNAYEERVRQVERASFVPLVFTTSGIASSAATVVLKRLAAMVQTSKTDHFFKLAPVWSPSTDLIDFGMAGKLLTSATRRCSPFVDSVSRI